MSDSACTNTLLKVKEQLYSTKVFRTGDMGRTRGRGKVKNLHRIQLSNGKHGASMKVLLLFNEGSMKVLLTCYEGSMKILLLCNKASMQVLLLFNKFQ